MRDRLIAHRPKVKPEDDHWMLDRWTPVEAHAMTQVYREVKDARGFVMETHYRSVCSCGWRSSEFIKPEEIECPVWDVLQQRRFRVRKNDRIEWKEVVVQPK